MGRGQQDAFSKVMGRDRGRPPTDPSGALPLSGFSENLSVPDEMLGYGRSPRTCAEILSCLEDLDDTLPLYVLHPENEDTMDEAERVIGGHTETRWDGDVHVCPDIGHEAPAYATLGDFKEMLRKQEPDQGVWFKPPNPASGETLTAYRLFGNHQGKQFLALITVY